MGAYFPPVITAAGLSIPGFSAIQQALLDSYQTIYGATTYLGNDSADYQWVSSLALKLNDNMNLCQLAYNARSPLTAIGADLDSIIKLNGIARLSAGPSTTVLTIVGSQGTVVNAVIQDENGNLWNLPPTPIGPGGTAMATATCQVVGPITAAAGTINNPVGGFTAGWTGVTNAAAAVPGSSYEADSAVRARQSISVALPSETRLAGTIADLLAVPGVTRINVLENQTSVTDGFGNESHSLTCVVEGGVALAIATAIYDNRGIGCNTLGATATTMTVTPVTDANSGNVTDIGFIIPTYVNIYVILNIHSLNSSYNSATQADIIDAVEDYLNSLSIGEEVTQSALYGAALSVMPNLSQPSFSIRALFLAITTNPTATADIVLLFYQVALGALANISITAV